MSTRRIVKISRRAGTAATALALSLAGAVTALAGSSSAPTPASPAAAVAGAPSPAALEFFEKKVRPVLAESCFACHSAKSPKPQGGLRMDSREALLQGGARGPALVPGKPEASLLCQAIEYHDADLQMPPSGKLAEARVKDVAEWVRQGAPWPASEGPTGSGGPTLGAKTGPRIRAADHWAFQPLKHPAIPAVRDRRWVKTPIDAFILAKLEAKGLRPAPPADRATLLRRASYDLLGLPPTPDEVERFVHDPSPRAWEKVVDRLLASPHYGERWGRHWLDLVRFAETRGHEFDPVIPNAWEYRDYVIRAFNADVPYNQFVREHLAGDLLPHPRLNPERGFNESILGTGFWFLGEEVHSPVDTRQDETDRMDNRIDTMAKAFTGLTLGCARCHDHKFDPISQKDYYGLSGFVLSSTYRQARFETMEQNRRCATQLDQLQREARTSLLSRAASVQQPVVDHMAAYLLAAAGKGEAAGLDAGLVVHWKSELERAATDRLHPLHPFARAAAGSGDAFPAQLDAALAGWKRSAPHAEDPAGSQSLLDYAHGGPESWMADGFVFGTRPVEPGDVVLGDSPDHPIQELVSYWGARQDPAWNRLHAAPGNEVDHGTLGSWDRPGRTIRTAKVTLRSGLLHYLVRGSGRAYASVDSHLIVAGPLHGRVLLQWKGDPNRWQWVTHDLRPYRGHRAEIEFTPDDPNSPLTVSRAIDSEADPGPAEGTNEALLTALAAAHTEPEAALAYQRTAQEVLRLMAADGFARDPRGADLARFGNWLIQHPELTTTTDGRDPMAQAAAPLISRRAELVRHILPESHTAPVMWEGNGVDETVLRRGSYRNPGDPAPRRFFGALSGENQPAIRRGSGRLELAERMLTHPLAARVMVNRVWQHHFGEGLVRTPDDFGTRGEAPTHPELLEWLVGDFVAGAGGQGPGASNSKPQRHEGTKKTLYNASVRKKESLTPPKVGGLGGRLSLAPGSRTPAPGMSWSLKALHRLILLSNTYQMASAGAANAEAADPADKLLHRMPVRRLEAEAIRDGILSVSGRLDLTMYGPGVLPYLTAFTEGRGRPSSGPLDGNGRRSIYQNVRRNFLSPFFLAFDYPVPFATVGKRSVSTVPAQALALLNNPFVLQQAQVWAKRVLKEPAPSRAARIDRLYLTAFARQPTAHEKSAALEFLEREDRRYGGTDDVRSWTDLCHVLINTKEFIFID